METGKIFVEKTREKLIFAIEKFDAASHHPLKSFEILRIIVQTKCKLISFNLRQRSGIDNLTFRTAHTVCRRLRFNIVETVIKLKLYCKIIEINQPIQCRRKYANAFASQMRKLGMEKQNRKTPRRPLSFPFAFDQRCSTARLLFKRKDAFYYLSQVFHVHDSFLLVSVYI